MSGSYRAGVPESQGIEGPGPHAVWRAFDIDTGAFIGVVSFTAMRRQSGGRIPLTGLTVRAAQERASNLYAAPVDSVRVELIRQ